MNVPIDITGVRLYTNRLILRPWIMEDLNDFYEYASVDGVGQMAGWQPHKDLDKSRQILTIFIEGRKTFALELNGKCIGSLGIEEYDEQKFPEFADLKVREIGFVLSKAYWGQGLMPEAVREVQRWLFEDIGLDMITCGYFAWNQQSARVQQKCGFLPYKTIQFETRCGTTEETIEGTLTRDAWQKRVASHK